MFGRLAMYVGMEYKGFKVTSLNHSPEDSSYSGEAEYQPTGEIIKFFSKRFDDLELAFKDACEEYLDYAAYLAYTSGMAEYLGRRYHVENFDNVLPM
jgi:hypothetical protein